MYCRHCGQKLSENAKFCGKCGAKVDMMQGDDASFVTEEAGNNQQPASAQEPDNDKNPRQGKLWWKIVLIIVICAAAVAVCLFGWHEIRERQFRNHMEVAQTFIDEENYDEAIKELCAAIDIDPKVVDPYIKLADAYKKSGNTEMVEGTIDDGRTMIVDTYERKGELPEDSETLYVDAVVDAVENDDNDRAEKIGKEYVSMVDEQAANDFKEKVEEKLNIEPDPDPEPIPDSEPPSEETVLEMLDLFEYWMDYHLFDWYTTDERYHNEETVAEFSAYEDIGMAQACAIAGRILGDQGNYEYAHDFESYCYVDGKMIPWDEVSEDSRPTGGAYGRLSIAQLDEYLSDLFGTTYNAEDFAEHADELGNDEVIQDEEGQMYTSLGDYGAMGVDVSIENIADTPDEDGTYKVLARYDEFYDDDIPEDTYYVQFRFKPDEDSKYGYVIVGMVPAGYGEIDPEFLSESSTEDTDDEEDASTEDVDWQQIYADYIENWEEADEDRTYEAMFINDDDIPELFVGGYGGFDAMGAVLFYIHDGQVEEYRGHDLVWYPSFIEREGYIYSLRGQMGGTNEKLAYLDEDSEMTVLFDGEYYQPDYDNPSEDDYFEINGERVTQAAYEEEASKIASWMENDTGEWDGSGITFATGASEAVQKLRSGEAASIIEQ